MERAGGHLDTQTSDSLLVTAQALHVLCSFTVLAGVVPYNCKMYIKFMVTQTLESTSNSDAGHTKC